MRYIVLAFDDLVCTCDPGVCDDEHPADKFFRRFRSYNGLRTQIEAWGAAKIELTPAEEKALWGQAAASPRSLG